MNTVPLIPETAPFSPEQRAWLNGFFAGVFSRGSTPLAGSKTAETGPSLQPLTILWGSQTGTAEGLAKRAAKEAGKRGFAPMVMDMASYEAKQLLQEKNLLVITSTYGDGEPPDNARALLASLSVPDARRCEGIRFSVLGLGDTNYEKFCQCAKEFDDSLEKLGAVRISTRVDCDLDYEANFTRWIEAALGAFNLTAPSLAPSPGSTAQAALASPAASPASGGHKTLHDRKNPFSAKLVVSRNLNGTGSAKETQHVEISLEGSTLNYEAGDALGVIPSNCPDLVADLLAALGCDGEEAVPEHPSSASGGVATSASVSLRKALLDHHDIGRPGKEFLQLVAERSGSPELATLLDTANAKGLSAWLHGRDILDVLRSYPAMKITPAEIIPLLKKLQPRLYSISSSPKANPGHVHLTVGAVRYEAHGRSKKGVCSTFLADRVTAGALVPVFVHHNTAFRPPADGSKPMIMVGPGTGIAPFRAFLQERQVTGATGKNWLFFGDQRGSTDFLYREELEQLRVSGILNKLDLAFSRDQADKIYVQHRMIEAANTLFSWLEEGAHFYVCGDASRMAKDVDAALHQVVERGGGKSPAQAVEYVQMLKSQKRYARDVY